MGLVALVFAYFIMIVVALIVLTFALRAVFFLKTNRDPIGALNPVIKRINIATDNAGQKKKLEKLG